MERKLRIATAIVLGLGGLAAIGLGAYLLAVRGSAVTGDELRAWSPVHRAMFVLAQTQHGLAFAGVFVVAGLVAGALGVALVRGAPRWLLLLVAAAALVLIVLAQWSKADIEQSEPRGYRDRSPYVLAARALATYASVYLALLVVLFGAVWWLSRARPAAAAGAPPPA